MFQRHKYKENIPIDTIKDPIGSIKYDGAHFFVRFDKEGVPAFISRRQSVKGHYPDRTEKLPQFHDIKLPDYAGHILSAELIHTGWNKHGIESHPNVSGILNSLPPRAKEVQKAIGPVRAVLLDVIKPELTTYKEKLDYLRKLEKQAKKPETFFVPDLKIGKSEIWKLIEATRNEGREGVIVTSLTGKDIDNPRSKIKHYKTFNLRVKGITQEIDKNGKPKPSAGALILEDASHREVGNTGTGFTREERIDIWNNPKKWLGQLVQIKAMYQPSHRGQSASYKLHVPVYNGLADGDIDTVS
jgi:hypothetical protein